MQNVPWDKIHALEEEIKALKKLGEPEKKKKSGKPKKDPIEGMLTDAFKNIKITEKDFEEVEKMWFDEEHILYQKHKK